jgi:hypothetical protein
MLGEAGERVESIGYGAQWDITQGGTNIGLVAPRGRGVIIDTRLSVPKTAMGEAYTIQAGSGGGGISEIQITGVAEVPVSKASQALRVASGTFTAPQSSLQITPLVSGSALQSTERTMQNSMQREAVAQIPKSVQLQMPKTSQSQVPKMLQLQYTPAATKQAPTIKIVQLPAIRPAQMDLTRATEITTTKSISITKPVSVQIIRAAETQTTVTRTISVHVNVPGPPPSMFPPMRQPPPVPPILLGGGGGFGASIKAPRMNFAQVQKYKPSVAAVLGGITATQKTIKNIMRSVGGVGIRPIQIGVKRRRR